MQNSPFRVLSPGFRRNGKEVTISFDGEKLAAIDGETVAAALAASGNVTYRQNRQGSPRGLYCGMGACFECLVTIDGKASQRACLVKVADGQLIRSAGPSGDRWDRLAPLTPPAVGVGPRDEAVDLLVIGAGPAGLAAALSAARRGASVVVLDERPESGGQYFKPLAPSHQAVGIADRQFRAGAELLQAARLAGVHLYQDTMVWGAISPDEVVAIIDGREIVFHPRRLVLAPGAYERPTPFSGWTLPGVMTTGAAQTLIRTNRVAPGQRVVIAGNGPLNFQLASELVAAGISVLAVVESAAKPSLSDWRALVAATRQAPDLVGDGVRYHLMLRQAGVPILWSHAILSASGDGRLARVRYAPVSPDGMLNMSEAIELEADALCLGYGFIPSTEIARALGCEHRLVDRHIGYLATKTAADGSTSQAEVFAVGDGADLGGSRVALARGTLAGIAAAGQLGYRAGDPAEVVQATRDLQRAEAFQAALWSIYRAPRVGLEQIPDDVILCRCEDLSFGAIRREIALGHDALSALKRNTRLGMGRCQGRYCASTAALLLEQTTGRGRAVDQFFAPRLPAKPIPAAAMAFEKPEWGGHQRSHLPNLARPLDSSRLADSEAAFLVIGGGVVGACLAYYLSAAGQDVLVVERDDTNLQASGANAGSLHVQLLSFDFGAKAEAGGGPAASTLPLGPRSIQLWQELQRVCGEDFEISVTGGLMVADSPAAMASLRAKSALERRFGIENAVIGANELRALAPALSEKLLGAEYAPQEGKINPLRATYAVLRQARRQGARFLRGANVTAITRDGTSWVVETSRCRIRAGRVINASGPWSREVGAMIGIDLPVHSAPLQMIVTEPAPPLVGHLVAHADRHLSLKQALSGGLIIGGAWAAAFHPDQRFNKVTRDSIEGNLWVANQVLPALSGLHVIRAWAAMNVDIDGAPIIGPVPGVPDFFNCVTSNGYTLAPVVARLSADLLLHGKTELDPTPYLIDRFG
jgi:glycine/D-amino acid oxidase-like deaminating enzyme